MKKLNILLAILIAVLGIGSLSAQTDVTSLYLTNAGFDESSSWITADVAQATIKAAKGWTATSSGDTWWYGGAANYGSSYKVNSVTPPTKSPNGKTEGGALGISAGWGCTVAYKQEVTLPAGIYTLNYKAYNANTGATQAYNYIGFTSSSVTAYGKTNNFTANTWVEESVTFALPSQTTGSISVGMGAISDGSGANAKLFVDGVTLSYYKSFSDITEANPVDLTSMSSNTWTNGGNIYSAGGVEMRERYFEDKYRTGDMMTQTISGLPTGIYKVELYANANWTPDRGSIKTAKATAGAKVSSVFANDVTAKVPLAHQTATTVAGEYTLNNVKVKDGVLNLGLRNDSEGANWLLIAVKSIIFLGPDKTLSESAFNENYATISSLNTNVPISAVFTTEIQTLKSEFAGISATDLTQSQLDEANGRMQNAINEYDANIDAYAKLKKYIDMTKVFDETGVASYEEKYNNRQFRLSEVESVRQELNVMRFNAASSMFTNKVDVTGWTGTMGERNDQHWSGTTISYKDANSWSDIVPDALTAQITLPKGNYVLKVAGRAHTNAALTLKVLGQVIAFHGKGDTGYGIDTNGNANFSPNGTYANNGTGRGWEWEFLKFSLDAEQTVILEVNSGYNDTKEVWTSFGDITLWMDDATYVTVNSHAIDAPLAEAKELVNSKPMGANVLTSLTEAIALCDNKASNPQELNSQIEALNKAITEAKRWVPLYDEAKAPLIAALERFERDFNNAEKGAFDYMGKNAWADVITKVQEAAIAKDITNNYDGFATAAEELNIALDVAQSSTLAYAALKAEIGHAEGYMPIIHENRENHTNAIIWAQSIYDMAETETDAVNQQTANIQDFRVEDYYYVIEYYNEQIELDKWSGQMRTTSGQHWDNGNTTYFDYYTENGASTHEAFNKTTLPAGEYVLIAAGRAAPVLGTQAYIKVGESIAQFASKGDIGYGIDINGNANFCTDGVYANNNIGRGWEYRFICFTLEEESEVELVAGIMLADSSSPLSWASICMPLLYKHSEETETSIDCSNTQSPNPELEISDLMGRKTTIMRKGSIYIVNGIKILIK